MKFKTTIILFILAALVFGYIWYIDRFKPSTEEKKQVEKRVFTGFEPPQITRITAHVAERQNSTGAIIRTDTFDIVNELDGWKLVEPVNFPADTPTIMQLLDAVKKLDNKGIITGDDYTLLDKELAGLTTPDIIATFYTPSTSYTINVGLNDPVGWNVYLQKPDEDAVYIARNSFKDILTMKLNDMDNDIRRRAIFDISKFRINSLIIEHPDETIELRRDDNLMWQLTQPVQDYAETPIIADLLDATENLRVDSFVDSPANFGQPRLTLTVVSGTASQRLIVGNESPYEFYTRYLARRSEYQQYITIAEKDIEPFMHPGKWYRAKELVIFNQFEKPEALTQTVNDDSITFEKDENSWKVKGLDTPLLDIVKVEDYTWLWREITVTDFVDSATATAALANPWITLTFKLQDIDTPREYVLSEPQNGRVYTKRSENVYVALNEADVRSLLITNSLDFLDKDVLNVPSEYLTEITFTADSEKYTLNKSSNQWIALHNDAVVEYQDDPTVIVAEAMPLTVVAYVARAGDKTLSEHGLLPPQETITFSDGTRSKTLQLGVTLPNGTRYGVLEGQPFIFVVPAETVQTFGTLLQSVQKADTSKKK